MTLCKSLDTSTASPAHYCEDCREDGRLNDTSIAVYDLSNKSNWVALTICLREKEKAFRERAVDMENQWDTILENNPVDDSEKPGRIGSLRSRFLCKERREDNPATQSCSDAHRTSIEAWTQLCKAYHDFCDMAAIYASGRDDDCIGDLAIVAFAGQPRLRNGYSLLSGSRLPDGSSLLSALSLGDLEHLAREIRDEILEKQSGSHSTTTTTNTNYSA
jgi:hypothetical protein